MYTTLNNTVALDAAVFQTMMIISHSYVTNKKKSSDAFVLFQEKQNKHGTCKLNPKCNFGLVLLSLLM